jgi:mycothiol synthase
MIRPHLTDEPNFPPLPAGYAIRLADGDQDERDLSHVLTTSFEEEWPVERVRSSLTAAPDVLAVYVVTWNDRPVATASSRYDPEKFPGMGYVHWVGGLPEHAGHGLGSALMARLLQDFRERGYGSSILETDDFRLPAIKVYLRHGFLPVYDVKGEDLRPRWTAIFQSILATRR